jgi:hypothetical protein
VGRSSDGPRDIKEALVRNPRIRALAVVLSVASLAVPFAARSAPATKLVYRTISTKAPAWYTRAMQRKVIAAGARGYTLPSTVSFPTAASLAFLGIRPGQLILVFSKDGTTVSLCTSNFVFRNGTGYAIGTAGHCGGVGDQVTMVTAPRLLVDIGNIVKSTGDAGPGNDFALIAIKPALNSMVSPSMAFWGGPVGRHVGSTTPLIVKHIGWGLLIGTGGTPRVGIGVSYSTAGLWRFEGVIAPGDSGSAANDGANGAIGNITHIAYNLGQSPFVWLDGTSIPRILQIAGLRLATCPTAIPWPLYGCPHL